MKTVNPHETERCEPAVPQAKRTLREELPGLRGPAKCRLAEASNCRILSLHYGEENGDFLADFRVPEILDERFSSTTKPRRAPDRR
jgi:hypothetical protein